MVWRYRQLRTVPGKPVAVPHFITASLNNPLACQPAACLLACCQPAGLPAGLLPACWPAGLPVCCLSECLTCLVWG